MKVRILQTNIISGNPVFNRKAVDKMFGSRGEVALYILPEMFTTGFCTLSSHGNIYLDDGQTLDWMIERATSLDAAIAGTVAVRDEHSGQRYNRFYFVQPDGTMSYYDKYHLFTPGHEERYFSKGCQKVIVSYRGVRFLLQTCYDLRFPVFSRSLGDYDVIIYCANWPELRTTHWDILTRARAIENQAYVIAANRVGEDQATTYLGHSAVIDSLGKAVGEASEGSEAIIEASLDIVKQNTYRKRFCVNKDADNFIIS